MSCKDIYDGISLLDETTCDYIHVDFIKGRFVKGKEIPFKQRLTYVETGEATTEFLYDYAPRSASRAEDDCCYDERVFSERVLAKGVASEYLITIGMFEEAVVTRKAFEEAITKFVLKKKREKLKKRTWF